MTPRRAAILDHIAGTPGITAGQIAARMGVTIRTVEAEIAGLKREGAIEAHMPTGGYRVRRVA